MNIHVAKQFKDAISTGVIKVPVTRAYVLDLYIKHDGDVDAVAREYGKSKWAVYSSLNRLEQDAGSTGFSTTTAVEAALPPSQNLTGLSVLYTMDKKTGEPKIASFWAKGKTAGSLDDEVKKAFLEELPRCTPVDSPLECIDSLITQYVITDYHLGMLAVKEENGDEDWNLDVAVNKLIRWFIGAVQAAPNSKEAILVQLGDFLHYDGLLPLTPASRHSLDSSTRFPLIIRAAIYALRTVIAMLLEKHEVVRVILAEGNHDEASSAWLREVFDVFYENEPRVVVDTSHKPYYAYKFGKCAFFYHHGHKKPMKSVDTVFAGMFPSIFGETTYRYAALGHYHHDIKFETNLMEVYQYRTLAPADAYSARGGYISGRDSKVAVFHEKYGKIAEYIIPAEMV